MNEKSVWRVAGYDSHYPGEEIFVAYFSDREKAHEVYHKGEHEYGMVAGYTRMRWTLERFYLDNNQHIEQMFEDVREAMEEAE